MIHVFGCSLSHGIMWDHHFDHKEKFKIHAVPAGDNTTQCRRFQDCVLHDSIHADDTILWQVTYPSRMGFRLANDHHFYKINKENKDVKHNFHVAETNILDGTKHNDYVAFNEKWFETFYYMENINQELQSLLFHMLMAKQQTNNKMLVWFAQADMFDPKTSIEIIKFLKHNQIKFIDYSNSIMTWTKRNKLAMDNQSLHPTQESYKLYIKKVIGPAINENTNRHTNG